MKTVVQRVTRAEVRVGGDLVGRIAHGLLLFVGVEKGDADADADATARKVAALRIFPGRTPAAPAQSAGVRLPEESVVALRASGAERRMDLTVADVGGACLVVSQFTLCAALGKGNRPSFEPAAEPARAEPLYLRVADGLRAAGLAVETGRFGADMAVELVNDGPVTFWIETRDGALVK